MTIKATIIADSVSAVTGKRITTFELEYPRFIHAEFMTHRLFSRNAASSRAIPVAKAIELIIADTARPLHWGKNQPGMSAKEECDESVNVFIDYETGNIDLSRETAWDFARNEAISIAKSFNAAGYHKQIVNRLLEPFTHIKVVCTATDYTNFFWLRKHPDAQPEIQELAERMWEEMEKSEPSTLHVGDWHTPYYESGFWCGYEEDEDTGVFVDLHGNTLEDALMISSSQCAQVSYRLVDDSLEKAKMIYDRLVNSKPVHASPFEHQATPIAYYDDEDDVYHAWGKGVTHEDANGRAWSGNFMDWIQHRQLIPGNAMNEVVK